MAELRKKQTWRGRKKPRERKNKKEQEKRGRKRVREMDIQKVKMYKKQDGLGGIDINADASVTNATCNDYSNMNNSCKYKLNLQRWYHFMLMKIKI